MKYTLLELTQRVLESMKSDAVDSIADTEESASVANIIRECYNTLISGLNLPENRTLFELDASGDNTKPCVMYLPSDVVGLEWLQYDRKLATETASRYQDLTWLDLEDFVRRQNMFNNENDPTIGVQVLVTGTSDTIPFYYQNDRNPLYYTALDDRTLVFDAYDSSQDSTLVKTKTKAYGLKEPAWSHTDNFVPPLDSQQFDILLKEAKLMAWQELKTLENPLAARQSRRMQILAQVNKDRANYNHKGWYHSRAFPYYGRK